MLIFWRQRLVVLANPKTGTTALEETLAPLAAVVVQRPPQLKHTGANKYHKFLAPYVGDGKEHKFQIVGVMREPVDWLGSWYRYRQRGEEVSEKSTHHVSFDDFVRAWCQHKPPEFAKVGSQANFLAPEGGRHCDRIFRYERFGRFVGFLENKLQTRIELPQVNVSPKGETALSPEVTALMRDFAAREFEIYETRAE
jgi:hypothetical protein